MKQLNKIYLLVFAVATLASCEKTVTNVDVPAIEKQLVLFGFISPENDYTSIKVTLSQPIYGKRNNPFASNIVTNAQVVITELQTNTTANLIFIDSLEEYAISKNVFTIKPGYSYKVSATTSDRLAEGITTVPNDTISFAEVNWYPLGQSANGNFPNGKFAFKWNDLAGTKNYYRILTQVNESPDFGDYTNNIGDDLYDDINYNGKTMQSTCEDYSYRPDTAIAVIYLLNTDKAYYEYMRRRLNYFYDDPFSEPTPQYNNVTGGLGVVCSYRFTQQKLKIY